MTMEKTINRIESNSNNNLPAALSFWGVLRADIVSCQAIGRVFGARNGMRDVRGTDKK